MKLIPPIETDIVSKSNITADFFKELTTINEVMKKINSGSNKQEVFSSLMSSNNSF